VSRLEPLVASFRSTAAEDGARLGDATVTVSIILLTWLLWWEGRGTSASASTSARVTRLLLMDGVRVFCESFASSPFPIPRRGKRGRQRRTDCTSPSLRRASERCLPVLGRRLRPPFEK
jgi:hypothetical protein